MLTMDGGVGVRAETPEHIEDEFEILTMDSNECRTESKSTIEGEVNNIYGEAKMSGTVDKHTLESTLQDNSGNEPVLEQKKESDETITNAANDEAWNWNSWTSWGSSVINTATSSVTTFTSQVGDGLIHVIESVESGLLTQSEDEVPTKDCEVHPRTDQNIDCKLTEGINDDKKVVLEERASGVSGRKSWLISSLSNVVNKTTSAVQHTTNAVVNGGLDMLESIGKKTYNVITEGDHGLKKAIEKNKQSRKMPNLSQALKEAKEIAELKFREEESLLESKKYLYGYWFDEYQGLVQLEAFEMLASQNEVRSREEYDRLPKDKLANVKMRLAEINEIYRIIDEDNEDEDLDGKQDFNQLLLDYVAKLPININVQKILECQELCATWLRQHENWKPDHSGENEDLLAKDVLKKSMQSLAEMTALAIQHFHKLAQLLTKASSSPRTSVDDSIPLSVSAIEIAQNVTEFSRVLNREFSSICGKFAAIFGKFESSDTADSETSKEVSEYITTIYLEASHSNNFVQKSLRLLLPALQAS